MYYMKVGQIVAYPAWLSGVLEGLGGGGGGGNSSCYCLCLCLHCGTCRRYLH